MQVPKQRIILWILILFFVGGLFFYRLGSLPPAVWDEGWTLNVARNWVEFRHMGQLLLGQPAPTGLSGSFWVFAPTALSFQLLGVGFWQGRLPFVIMMLVCLGVIYWLTSQLYGKRSTALAAVGVLLFMSGHEQLNVFLNGRRVLGEVPAVLYLLSGYAFLLLGLRRNPAWLLGSVFFFGVALVTKAQVLPFWAFSMGLACAYCVYRRWWYEGFWAGLVILGTWYPGQFAANWIHNSFITDRYVAGTQLTGLTQSVALVWDWNARSLALRVALTAGLPILLGLLYAGWDFWLLRKADFQNRGGEVARMALFGLVGSWYIWYLVLGMYWPRYLFPAFIPGSIFIAPMLERITSGFNGRKTVRLATWPTRKARATWKNYEALLAVIVLAISVPLTARVTMMTFAFLGDRSPTAVAEYLNEQTPVGSVIESFDTVLYFMLDRPYHYPPDQLHITLNSREFLGLDVPVDYDPMAANPDYLVVGPSGKEFKVYQPTLDSGKWKLVHTEGSYDIYVLVDD